MEKWIMEENENTIVIRGKEINFENYSDEQLVNLYQQLKIRQLAIIDKVLELNKEVHLLTEDDIIQMIGEV
jgi:hypothetical protein